MDGSASANGGDGPSPALSHAQPSASNGPSSGTAPGVNGGGSGPGQPPAPPRLAIPVLPPRGAIEKLLEVYNQFIQFHNPTLHMPTFLLQLTRVLDTPDLATEEDLFFVLMFLGPSPPSPSFPFHLLR